MEALQTENREAGAEQTQNGRKQDSPFSDKVPELYPLTSALGTTAQAAADSQALAIPTMKQRSLKWLEFREWFRHYIRVGMGNLSILPPEYGHLEGLIDSAVREWAPSAKLRVIKPLGGFSGAAVLKVDISGGSIPAGQYILKVYDVPTWEGETPEKERHELACSRNQQFASEHIPNLRRHFREAGKDGAPDRAALLYEIAGFSLESFRTIDAPDAVSGAVERSSAKLFRDLLESWSDDQPSDPVTPRAILKEWLGYRLEPEKAKKLHELGSAEFGAEREVVRGHESVINPLWLCIECQALDGSADVSLRGLLHGDLHAGNVLTHRAPSETAPYWIIDFALSRVAAVGYDHAYFEVGYILSQLPDAGPEQIVGLLKALEVAPGREELPAQNVGIAQTLRAIRRSQSEWQKSAQPRRFDPLSRQFALARIAAGLNWANKVKLGINKRRLALYYSAWCARRYMEDHQAKAWKEISVPLASRVVPAAREPDKKAADALWAELWERAHRFDPAAGRYVLISEALGNRPGLESLGLLPWSLVVDLDNKSDGDGLYAKASPLLEGRRSLSTFALDLPTLDFDRGTMWMMACGWDRKSFARPTYDIWRRKFLPQIREVCGQMRKATSPTPVHVIVLPSDADAWPNKGERLVRLVNEIDEAFLGDVRIILLGEAAQAGVPLAVHLPVSLDSFVDRISSIYGAGTKLEIPQIPGQDGVWRVLPVDVLRHVEQSLDVLHSRILDEAPAAPPGSEGAFWRGHLPTWTDLNADADIRRDIHDVLIEEVRGRLVESRNYTIELYHTPGAGGSTAAYRAAWSLRNEFPTAILRRYSAATNGHLEAFFHAAQRSVLVVADAFTLPDSARENLYRDMASRNCRVVLLYVRRILKGGQDYKLQLIDPMGDGEAARFRKEYANLTDDSRRKQELEKITSWPQLNRYRSAFFYGLITFERDFQKIEAYVKTHLEGLRRKVRDVLGYLALVTRFSDGAIHEVLLRRLLNVTGDTKLTLSELLGEGPARLVVNVSGRVKLMHPLVAEEVLAVLRGGDGDRWRLDLADLSLDFLRDVADAVPTDSDEIKDLFRRLFITRESRFEGAMGMRDVQHFSELIEAIDAVDKVMGQRVLEKLCSVCPAESHFWNHRGRHHVYRMKREHKQAEEFVQEAIRLAPNDPIHYHTLGLVQRSWIAHRILNDLKGCTPDRILGEVDGLYASAARAFATARKLNPADEYGYITHIQMVIWIGRRLKEAGSIENIAELGTQYPAVGKWLTENLAQAEALLAAAENLYNSLAGSRYMMKCVAGFKQLYGDLENVIRTWELLLSRGLGEPGDRRALAHAYLARRSRSLSSTQKSEARRIVQLMEQNLARSGGEDEDFRLWFEAYKRLDEFDVDHALHRLRIWGERFEAGRAYYYMYVLQFLLWLRGDAQDTSALNESLRECERLAVGRRTRSFEWLGRIPLVCPLVSEEELGGWNGNLRFWNSPGPLRRVNGVIEHMNGQRAGNVIIDGRVRAFFVPGPRFWKINQEVSFYLGFSFEGLRAWQPEPGWVEEGARGTVRDAPGVPARAETKAPTPPLTEEQLTDTIRSSLKQRVTAFISDLAAAKAAIGSRLLVTDLEDRLSAVFGMDDLYSVLGFRDVRELLQSLETEAVDESVDPTGPDEVVTEGGTDSTQAGDAEETTRGVVCRYDRVRRSGHIDDGSGEDAFFVLDWVAHADRRHIRRGATVDFLRKQGDKGPLAWQIHVVEPAANRQMRAERKEERKPDRTEHVPTGSGGKPERVEVVQYILELLGDHEAKGDRGRPVLLATVGHKLRKKFPSHPQIHRALGFASLGTLVRSINGVVVEGTGAQSAVRLDK